MVHKKTTRLAIAQCTVIAFLSFVFFPRCPVAGSPRRAPATMNRFQKGALLQALYAHEEAQSKDELVFEAGDTFKRERGVTPLTPGCTPLLYCLPRFPLTLLGAWSHAILWFVVRAGRRGQLQRLRWVGVGIRAGG